MKSLIQVANPSVQAVADNGIISLGSVQRRCGCNCRLSGNAIEISGEGFYTIDFAVTVSPTAAGDVVVTLNKNGEPITGAVASATGTAGDPVTLSGVATIRQSCCCESADNVTVVLESGAGDVSNISVRVVKV